ncbi:putative Co/Zn/Cd cation transporter (cation efflux family) [Tahibacter aquaticus]|uniref:Putative Co/Zn/Cd cation transporter (Cation efflux family) n=1 Tax=Tahibacter aquaticus TaxID=520092 RepID=A0A4R6YNR4_9GAMM|nr:cation transporter [Tahibacter aquaticus]TDR39109.1 putative Co/Zn/Cd cation transporter (cation efflux family) [Tahibacter aquaticus]
MDTSQEQIQLRLSIVATLVVGATCVAVGLILQSQAIAFDGFYSLIDVVLTTAALAVSRLIASEGSRRFQFGYWHLEPLVVVFNAAVMAMTCAYAAVTALQDLLGGGHELAFGIGAAWAALVGVFSLGMAAYMRHKARQQQSALLVLDARGWLIGGCINFAVLLGFAVAALIADSQWQPWTRFIDSTVLLLLTLSLLPLPLSSLWRALREVLQLAPDALDTKVHAVMNEIVAARGYLDFRSYVAKVGRMRFIDISILLPANAVLGQMADVDAARAEIATRLGSDIRAEWLTIVFTAKREWL